MFCPRCKKYVRTTEVPLHVAIYKIEGNICRIDCKICHNFIAAKFDDDIIDINNCLDGGIDNGWNEVQTNREKLIYYVLSHIIYPELDPPNAEKYESLYDFPDDSDRIFLCWANGRVIGFYTVKPKGTEILETREIYTMPVLDTAYIRSEYRRKGFGSDILSDIVKRFPNQDIGFSIPISHGMLKVLKTFLTKHQKYRLCFWEIADYDIIRTQQLIWYRLRQYHI